MTNMESSILLEVKETLSRLLSKYSSNVNYLEVKASLSYGLSVNVENGVLKGLSRSDGIIVGVRALVKGSWGVSFTDMVSEEEFEKVFKRAVSSARALSTRVKGEVKLSEEKVYTDAKVRDVEKKFEDVDVEDKLNLVFQLDKGVRGYDKRIVNCRASYFEGYSEKIFLNSEGADIYQKYPLVFLFALVIAREADKTQLTYDVIGGQYGYEKIEELDVNEFSEKLGKEVVELLSAETIKGGTMTVVMDGRVSGTFAHEVFGHAAEADNVLNAKSFLSGLIGKKIGSDLVTIVDDATVPGAYGSFFYDDEGVPAQRKHLLEKGVLKTYMHNRETAGLMSVKSTGNGRAQSPGSRIYVRMTNTFIAPGDWNPDEIIEETKHGVYVAKALGGMEDPVGGGFQVSALKAWLIEKGELTKLLRAVSISGKALDILKNIDAVGKDFVLEPGTCGKGYAGDMVPVTTGGPTVRVSEMIVGVGGR